MGTAIFCIFFLWLLFNWLAPFSCLCTAERISLGRIPAGILQKANACRVRFYTSDLGQRGYAFCTLMGWRYAVIIDRKFMQVAHPAQVRFVLAHELGHCALGHVFLRWVATVTTLGALPPVRRWMRRKEQEADAWAESLSGLPRRVLEDWRIAEIAERA